MWPIYHLPDNVPRMSLLVTEVELEECLGARRFPKEGHDPGASVRCLVLGIFLGSFMRMQCERRLD